jgi:Raf kinase inhibitor-like YbhB/YbcL family protein
MRRWLWLVMVAPALVLCGSKKAPSSSPPTPTPGWKLQSSAFREGRPIDRRFTCDGKDLSPPLAWPVVPGGAKSLALIVDDPDAPSGTFTHWLLWGMKPERTSLPEGVLKLAEVPGVGRQGTTGFGKIGYGGPCPPPGLSHHYRFKLYGLSSQIELAAGASKEDLEKAISGKVVAHTVLTGTYKRATR